MSDQPEPTALEIHTLESLCAELVSGRTVLVNGAGETFCFDAAETRSLFDWYRRNRAKWAGNVQKTDVDALADELEKAPPKLAPAAVPSTSVPGHVIHLKALRAHRFAGIHRYGAPDSPPEDFSFEFRKPVTLIEGMNGAGKTSLLSAITWCLTGHVYRSQRPPETIEEPVPVDVVDQPDAATAKDTANDITAITPLPPASVLSGLRGERLPFDTWVELAFVDSDGNDLPPVRRSVERTPRKKIKVSQPDITPLGLSPIALEVGTKMPGLIPYVQLGKPSDLGQAVATITGLRPLQDLARHAAKSQAKLRRDLVEDREREIAAFDSQYRAVQDELAALLKDNPSLAFARPVPPPSSDPSIEEALTSCSKHLEDQQAQALSETRAILGNGFDPNDRTARQNLIDNVGPAIGLLDPGHLGGLPSAARLRGLAGLTEEQLEQTENLIAKMRAEGRELAQLAEAPTIANRLRLYARVAGWMKSQAGLAHPVEDCPVCQTALEGRIDPITNKLISAHLERFVGTETEYLEKTLDEWQRAAVERLTSQLPRALAAELRQDLPERPADLIAGALGEELFQSPILRKSLAPLQATVKKLCIGEFEGLPPFIEPVSELLPSCFGAALEGIVAALARVDRAVAFARWRRTNDERCVHAFRAIIGDAQIEARRRDDQPEKWSLADRLHALNEMVKKAGPTKEALAKIATMTQNLAARRQKEARIALYGRTANAIEPILRLESLVERQVSSLMSTLSSETSSWKERLYSPAFSSAPSVCGADVGADGSLVLEAAAGGTKASAHQISNASDLRATLVAFLVSFWRHLLDTRGGLSLLLFDDLHELFDPANRRRVANALPTIVGDRGRLIVTSNDREFGTRVSSAFAEGGRATDVDRRCLHPPNGVRPRIELGVFLESVEVKRLESEKPENDDVHQPARDYVNELRIYIEDRLLGLFDVRPARLPDKPTLADLVDAIRASRSAGVEPFTSPAFSSLISEPALASGSGFLGLMNESHHGRAHDITCAMVRAEAATCKRVCNLVNAALEAYERWLRRDPAPIVPALPELPVRLKLSVYTAPIIEKLAAFTAEMGPSEAIDCDEVFSTGSLDTHAVYVMKGHNLGFSGPVGCRVLVTLSEQPPPDNSLVIALHRDHVSAGRLHRDPSRPELVVLASEAENPLKRPPSLFVPANEVRLLQISGVLFDFSPNYSRSAEHAVLEPLCPSLDRIKVVFKVQRDSALPLAIEGQKILGGELLSPAQIAGMEGRIVAIATMEGCALKRIGKALARAQHVRQFESVGGLGESLLVRTEDVDGDAYGFLPLLVSAREVLGVLY